LVLENAVLRHQIDVLRRGCDRPTLHLIDRLKLGGPPSDCERDAPSRGSPSPERRGEVERRGLLAAAGFLTGEACSSSRWRCRSCSTGRSWWRRCPRRQATRRRTAASRTSRRRPCSLSWPRWSCSTCSRFARRTNRPGRAAPGRDPRAVPPRSSSSRSDAVPLRSVCGVVTCYSLDSIAGGVSFELILSSVPADGSRRIVHASSRQRSRKSTRKEPDEMMPNDACIERWRAVLSGDRMVRSCSRPRRPGSGVAGSA